MAGEDWQGADVHFPERRAGDTRGCDRRVGRACAELKAKGVPVKEGSWGYRLLVVDDPDGNQLFFNYPNECPCQPNRRTIDDSEHVREGVMMQQQDVARVLSDPLAQELMRSNIPARLAYVGPDGFPRAIPIGFHWNGAEFVVCTVPDAPKVSALKANPKVAFTVDTNAFPPHVLLVRGTAAVDIVDGIPPEYLAASRKGVGPDQWDAFEAQVRALYKQMARIKITPLWAKLLDFMTRFPTPIEKLIRRAS